MQHPVAITAYKYAYILRLFKNAPAPTIIKLAPYTGMLLLYKCVRRQYSKVNTPNCEQLIKLFA